MLASRFAFRLEQLSADEMGGLAQADVILLATEPEIGAAAEAQPRVDNNPAALLPALATAGDVREVVKFLKKKPAGVTIVEAMEAVKKRLFEPAKIAAYEYWGIIQRDGERIRLSPLGWDFAERLTPEAGVFRLLLKQTTPYHSALQWLQQQQLDLVTDADIAAYWAHYHPGTIEATNQKVLEGQIVSFFHVCQAAELGVMTVGKRGQPARLRVDHEELTAYLHTPATLEARPEVKPLRQEQLSTGRATSPTRMNLSLGTQPDQEPINLRVALMYDQATRLAKQARLALELAEIDSEIIGPHAAALLPLPESNLRGLRRCNAAIIIISLDDYQPTKGEAQFRAELLVKLSAARVLYDQRVLLLWDKQVPVPTDLAGLSCCQYDGPDLSWELGVNLLKAIKTFKP